jgi:TonB family protein
MNLYWSNLLAWCVQIAIVVAVCAAVSRLFRLPVSRARLWYWHIILLICLALPLLQPWAKSAPGASNVSVVTGQFRLAADPAPAHVVISWPVVALAVLISGIGLRLLWLGLGLAHLRRYRATALPLEQADDGFADMRLTIAPEAEILISGNIASPVTFGLRRPVILLPDGFAGLSVAERASIVCHELIHIRRHDWAIAIAEELVRSIFWFHPAIWWLLGQIQLTREQVVDREVIRCTGDRNRYLDALLAIASLRFSADLAPAPLFLKKHHLRQRVESIVSGVTMTKRNLLLPLAAAFATLPVVIGIAAWQFPLRAAPQEAVDDSGVEVQLGAAKLLHRTGIPYPELARAKHISGTIQVNLTLNDKGEVTDAVAVSGPQELRRPVIQSVLNWHFSQDSGSTPDLQIAVHFDAAKGAVPKGSPPPALSPALKLPRTIEGVNLDRLPTALWDKVAESCGLTATSTLPTDDLPALEACLRNVDDHIRTQAYTDHGKFTLMVGIPAAQQPANPPKSIRVGGNVQAANILQKVTPKYPPEAKQARVQGTVRFTATIGPDGLVKNLDVVSGDPMLVGAAMDAVKQWVYKPTLLNGNPVEVITTIDINFTLNQ